MNIIIVTQKDPFYIPIFFREFFRLYDKDSKIKIKGVLIQEALGYESMFSLAKKMFDFYGLIDFFKQSCKYGISKINDLCYSLGIKKQIFSVKFFVENNDIRLLDYTNVNSKEFLDFVNSNDIDLIVSVSASQIFDNEVLNIPKYGCINLHNAPLPKYRGMLSNFWQMYHDEKYSVLTIHEMAEELDQGRIIYQQKTKIKDNMTLDDLIKATKFNSAHALWKVLQDFITGDVEYRSLPNIEGSYFSFPTREDVKKFKAKGKRLL